MPLGDKHFDPEKSKTLKYIQEGDEGHFGEHLFEQIASAEAPKVFPRQEPEWAHYAREKSERARSRTPADPTQHYTSSTTPLPTNYYDRQRSETPREFMEKSRTFTHTNRPQYGPPYYQMQYHQRSRGHSEPRETRGYECGGLDYTKGLHFPSVPYEQYLENRRRRASDVPPTRSGYEMGGTDFGKGYVAPGPYRGHGPDPPRLRSHYSADPRSPCNSYYAPNVDEVDANLLVGDTISNQKVSHEVRHIDQSEFGTSFAPPPGFKRDHITVRRSPPPPEPVTFSISANKALYGKSAGNPSTSSYQQQQNMWTQSRAPDAKEVPPSQPPAWHSKAARTHNIWQAAADTMNTQAQNPDTHPQQQTYEMSQTVYSSGQQPYHSQSPHEGQQQQQQSYISSQRFDDRSDVAQGAPVQQTYTNSGLSNGNNAELQVNSGYNINQTDYVRDHFDKYRAGPKYGSPHYEQMNQSSYSKTYSSSSQQQQHLGQQNTAIAIPAANQSYSYSTETRISQAPPPLSSNSYQQYHPQPQQQQHFASKSYHQLQQQQQQFGSNYNQSSHFTEATRTSPIMAERAYEGERFHQMFTSEQARTIPIQSTYSKESGYRHRSESTKQETTTAIPVHVGSNQESYNRSYSSHSNTQSAAPTVQPVQNYSSSSYHTESQITHNPPIVQHSPAGSYKSYQSSHYSKQEKTTSTTTSQQQPHFETTILPVTKTTSYSYQQQSVPSVPAPIQMSQSSFTSHTEKTNTVPEMTPMPGSRASYQEHLNRHREETHREETTRPVSQLSSYNEQRSYKRNMEEKTETRTIPATANVYSSDSNRNFTASDVFNRKEDMSETLPLGSISNTHANTQGGYRDQHGHDVSYKREMQTAVDPGKEYALLKEEEKRVVETDLEPGVISRHVTTKYYKKKTVTDTTTTTTPQQQ
ncbi:ZM protein [Parelaphostrongylus tenuis]|uniref:ZM protein n=1 Tax=Parelaphostrongylus tenuis TaxID=148309 RepID=A0AAD5N7F6_PARTN|nr:ZM protein [Parelaphostrongylus tenuis]